MYSKTLEYSIYKYKICVRGSFKLCLLHKNYDKYYHLVNICIHDDQIMQRTIEGKLLAIIAEACRDRDSRLANMQHLFTGHEGLYAPSGLHFMLRCGRKTCHAHGL